MKGASQNRARNTVATRNGAAASTPWWSAWTDPRRRRATDSHFAAEQFCVQGHDDRSEPHDDEHASKDRERLIRRSCVSCAEMVSAKELCCHGEAKDWLDAPLVESRIASVRQNCAYESS